MGETTQDHLERRRGLGNESADVGLIAARLDVVLAKVHEMTFDLYFAGASQIFGPDRQTSKGVGAEDHVIEARRKARLPLGLQRSERGLHSGGLRPASDG